MEKIIPSSFALRLPKSTRKKAMVLAEDEGISLNQFIVLAIAEKIVKAESAIKTLPRKPANLSAAGRKRIAEAQRKRWAKQKAK